MRTELLERVLDSKTFGNDLISEKTNILICVGIFHCPAPEHHDDKLILIVVLSMDGRMAFFYTHLRIFNFNKLWHELWFFFRLQP